MECTISKDQKAGVTVVWHYNAFLSYDVKPVEEERVWLDADTANQTQVDVNSFLLQGGINYVSNALECSMHRGALFSNAQRYEKEEETEKESTLDCRA